MRRERRALSRVGLSVLFYQFRILNIEGREVPLAASCFTKGVCWISVSILKLWWGDGCDKKKVDIRFEFKVCFLQNLFERRPVRDEAADRHLGCSSAVH